MELSFVKPHKSITSFPTVNLPNFAVITGINGAGKTHLLEAIGLGLISVDNITPDQNTKPIRRFDWTNLVPQDTGPFNPSQITQERYALWSEISQYYADHKQSLSQHLYELGRPDLINLHARELWNLTAESLVTTDTPLDEAIPIATSIREEVLRLNELVTGRFLANDSINRRRLLNAFSSEGAPLITLEENEFFDRFPQT
jgi:hypothetical protein